MIDIEKENKLIDMIVSSYGIQHQVIQLGEEMGELFTAISHRLRNRTLTNREIREEIADVIFMLRQMARFFDISVSDIEVTLKAKEDRMMERLKNESNLFV